MKAIVTQLQGALDALSLQEVPDPVAGAGELRVRVRGAGVNPVATKVRVVNICTTLTIVTTGLYYFNNFSPVRYATCLLVGQSGDLRKNLRVPPGPSGIFSEITPKPRGQARNGRFTNSFLPAVRPLFPVFAAGRPVLARLWLDRCSAQSPTAATYGRLWPFGSLPTTTLQNYIHEK